MMNSRRNFRLDRADTAFSMSSTLTRRQEASVIRSFSLAGDDTLLVVVCKGCSQSFVDRCDDNAKVKEKMIYAASKDELKKRLVGIATEVQANDMSGFDIKDVVDRVSKV